MRMRLIARDFKIFVAIAEQGIGFALDHQLWQGMRRARQLLARLLKVIGLQMAIAAHPDKIAHIQIALVRHHVGEQGIRRDVERHAQKNVGAALVHLA